MAGLWPLYERLSTMGFLISINSNGTPAGRGPRGPAGRASAHTHQHHALRRGQ
ncbi:MAG: hypothetical protein ACLUEK_11040 [Oscillospiraceae bacterium]